MKRLVLACGILVSLALSEPLSYNYNIHRKGEANELYEACVEKKNQQACKTLISKANLERDAKKCRMPDTNPEDWLVGMLLGNSNCYSLAKIFYSAEEYHISKAFFERLCQAGGVFSCATEGFYYNFGYGVKQDYLKARELYKKSCDMKVGIGCFFLATLYHDGLGVRQNLSIAKQYCGKACDLGIQEGCDLYRTLNEQGVQ